MIKYFKHGLLGLAVIGFSGCGGDSSATATPLLAFAPSKYEKTKKLAQEKFQADLAQFLEEASEWLANNAREEGVITTMSGLQYKVIKATPNPDGKRYDADQPVTVHYEGRLTDGTVFDSTFSRGKAAELKPSELVEGWQEALTLMKPGDEWTLYIPPSLGYGERGLRGSIPANAALIFDVELR